MQNSELGERSWTHSRDESIHEIWSQGGSTAPGMAPGLHPMDGYFTFRSESLYVTGSRSTLQSLKEADRKALGSWSWVWIGLGIIVLLCLWGGLGGAARCETLVQKYKCD